jgi:hypothetical protein
MAPPKRENFTLEVHAGSQSLSTRVLSFAGPFPVMLEGCRARCAQSRGAYRIEPSKSEIVSRRPASNQGESDGGPPR